MSRRYLVLHLPRLTTDRIRQREPALADCPVAAWAMVGNRRMLTCIDAPGTTLHAGQALADAQAMYPDLILHDADPDGDATFLERLALWAMRFTPIAATNPPDGLVLDVTGCTGLFGGEAALLSHVSDSLSQGGVTACGIIAGIAEAGAALARAARHQTIVPPGQDAVAVAALPLAVLPLSPDCWLGCTASASTASKTFCASRGDR